MNIKEFIEKEKYNNAYADGFAAGIEKSESTIRKVEQRLYDELKAAGMKTPILRHTPIFNEIIELMKD